MKKNRLGCYLTAILTIACFNLHHADVREPSSIKSSYGMCFRSTAIKVPDAIRCRGAVAQGNVRVHRVLIITV